MSRLNPLLLLALLTASPAAAVESRPGRPASPSGTFWLPAPGWRRRRSSRPWRGGASGWSASWPSSRTRHGAPSISPPGPVRCDEGGGGTGDLPPDSVLVIARSATGQELPFYPGAIEVTGVLDLGSAADDAGRPSSFRITLDRPTTPNGGQIP